MAKRGAPPRKAVRTTASGPAGSRERVRQGPPPASRPITGRILAVLLAGMFIAAVLVIAVKAFGAAGHPTLGLWVGIACLVTSGLIIWVTARKRSS